MKSCKVVVLCVFSCLFLTSVQAFGISWGGGGIDSALKRAKSLQKPVMADFYIDNCPWCDKLEDDTLSDSKVSSLSSKFVCVKVNGADDVAAARKYGVSGYPDVVFLDGNGRVLDRVGGYVGPTEFAVSMENALKAFKPAVPDKTAKSEPHEAEKKGDTKSVKKVKKDERLSDAIKTVKKGLGHFDLTGIVNVPGGWKAIINDKMVGIGDTVDGATVKDITRYCVKLKQKSREIKLFLPE